jgi:hypothetical protein
VVGPVDPLMEKLIILVMLACPIGMAATSETRYRPLRPPERKSPDVRGFPRWAVLGSNQ